MINESKYYILKLKNISPRYYCVKTQQSDLIKIKNLKGIDNFDVRRSFNISKDIIISRSKIPNSLTLYISPKKNQYIIISISLLLLALVIKFYHTKYKTKSLYEYETLYKSFAFSIFFYLLYLFNFKLIKKIEVINLKDNIVRLFLLHKHFDVNFETLRYNQNNYILSVKDKKYYLAERNVNIYRNEDLVYAILRGYKIKNI